MSPNSSRWDRACYAVVRTLGLLQLCILRRLVREPCWKSADGTVRRMRDMRSGHIENCRRMLEREGASDSSVYAQLRDEQVRRAVRS